MRDSLLQESADGRVRCNVCQRRCTLVPGGFGWCRTRHNRNDRLVTLIYGAASSVASNPIEKKPLYHFHPGTKALTAGSWSCNFGCPWCQNWDITKVPPPGTGEYISPEEFVEMAKRTGCAGTSVSFNEPTLSLEWSLDVFHLAREGGLYNTYVTNGYMTQEALSLLIDSGLNAMNVDVKGNTEAVKKFCKGIDVKKVWATCKLAVSAGVHIEITTLVIPTVNDADATLRGIAERIVTDLGKEVPWHVSRYYPAYRFNAPGTDIRILEHAWQAGKDAGLEYVYTGNLPGHNCNNTYCPSCGKLLIHRSGLKVGLKALRSGQCVHCGRQVGGVWGSD